MKKEYSDLPKAQKDTYLLDNTITIILTVCSMIVFAGWLLFEAGRILKFVPWVIDTSFFSGLVILALGFVMLLGVFLGYAVKNGLRLYTDLDLERAEKRVQKIKDALKDE